jgi:hypothetical protein
LRFGRTYHLVAEIAAQVAGRAQIHWSSVQKRRQLSLNPSQADQAGLFPALKLDEKIDIALWSVGALEHRSKQRQAADVVAPTDGAQSLVVREQRLVHRRFLTACGGRPALPLTGRGV